MTIYKCRWFETLEAAQKFWKEHGGVLYKGTSRSHTKKDHIFAGFMFNFDAEKYPFSVNWNEFDD